MLPSPLGPLEGAGNPAQMLDLGTADQLKDWVANGCTGVFVLDLPVSQTVVAEYIAEGMQGIPTAVTQALNLFGLGVLRGTPKLRLRDRRFERAGVFAADPPLPE